MPDRKYFKRLIWIGYTLVFLAVAFFVFQGISEKEGLGFPANEIKEIKIGENIFQTEVVDSFAKRKQGLSGRKELCEECAMIFLFDEKDRHAFWMEGMNFDLDMIWIDGKRIVDITKNVSRKKEQEIVRPDRAADRVLEIGAGLADKLEIKPGDYVEF